MVFKVQGEVGIIAICKIAMKSEPSDQNLIWTVNSSHCRSIGDRDFEMTKTLDNKNPEIAICDIAIQSQPLNKE
jgi:hypothetical protein